MCLACVIDYNKKNGLHQTQEYKSQHTSLNSFWTKEGTSGWEEMDHLQKK